MSIYKAYDVRGIYPEELNEDIAYKIGRAFVSITKSKTVAIGYDARLSAQALFDALAKGITEQGADVVNIGMCSTDMIYFATAFYKFDGGIMITASHNPKEYNGMKFCKKDAVPISGETGVYKMENLVKKNVFPKVEKKGKITKKDVFDDYIKKCLSFIDVKKIKPFKIVVDAGNGVAGLLIDKLEKHLPCKFVKLYFKPDGNFPNHLPSPIEEKNLKDLKDKIKEEKADLGIAFDGDADRVFLIDENNEMVTGTVMTALITKSILQKNPGSKILYNIVCGWIVPETIEKFKGKGIITPVGHSIIKDLMRKHDAIFAGEHSGHYYFRDNYYADSGLIGSLIVLELISKEDKPFSDVLKEFRKYYAIPETNFKVEDKEAKIKEIKQIFKGEKMLDFDGIRVDLDDFWFNVRPSNTEPLLRLNLEAKSKEIMEKRRDEVLEIIKS